MLCSTYLLTWSNSITGQHIEAGPTQNVSRRKLIKGCQKAAPDYNATVNETIGCFAETFLHQGQVEETENSHKTHDTCKLMRWII